MEFPKSLPDSKMPNMIMCGDHSSFIKPDLHLKGKQDDKSPTSASVRVSPVASKSDKLSDVRGCSIVTSEAALRTLEGRRRNKSMDTVPIVPIVADNTNRSLLHAALGSFRWPPYLLLVWIVLLLLTHVLHCLLTLLTSSLPHVKKMCQRFRQWTEQTWRQDPPGGGRLYPIVLAGTTAALYLLYFAMYTVYSIVLWSTEPLNADSVYDKSADSVDDKPKVTNYLDEVKDSKSKL